MRWTIATVWVIAAATILGHSACAENLVEFLFNEGSGLTADQLAGGVLFLFADSFESGTTSAWSAAVP